MSLCVTSEQAGPRVDPQAKDSFMEALQDETCLSFLSSDVQSIFQRLVSIYNLSHESAVPKIPHVIVDDDSEDVSPSRAQDSTESLLSLVPWTPTCANLQALPSSRPNKRPRLC